MALVHFAIAIIDWTGHHIEAAKAEDRRQNKNAAA